MKTDRRLVWALPSIALAALLVYGLRQILSAPLSQAGAPVPVSVVALYDGRPTRPPSPDPRGVHVADVAIGAKGAWLLGAGDQHIGETLKAALAELAVRPFLPAMEEGGEGGDTTIGVSEIKPGDERYPWAVGSFLRERTGLKYDVRPYVTPKAP